MLYPILINVYAHLINNLPYFLFYLYHYDVNTASLNLIYYNLLYHPQYINLNVVSSNLPTLLRFTYSFLMYHLLELLIYTRNYKIITNSIFYLNIVLYLFYIIFLRSINMKYRLQIYMVVMLLSHIDIYYYLYLLQNSIQTLKPH